MASNRTQSSMNKVMAVSGAVGLVALLAFVVIGGWSFVLAFFVALILAGVVFFILLAGFHEKPGQDAPELSAPSPSPQPSPKPSPQPAAARTAAPAPEPNPAPAPEPNPAPASAHPAPKPAAGAATADGSKPQMLSAARAGGADDLKKIKGVGPKLEKTLNEMGVYHFDQIAGWSAGEIAWVDENLEGFKGRVSRDDWVAQARDLASGKG